MKKINIKSDLYSKKSLNKFPNIITTSYIVNKAALLFPKKKFKIRKIGYDIFEFE